MTSELFAKYDVHVPRYTSYPTVPAWHAAPTAAQWTASLQRALTDPSATLSLYVHLPFCESLCTFCGCNTVITRDHGRSQAVHRPRPSRARSVRADGSCASRAAALASAPRWRHADVRVRRGAGAPGGRHPLAPEASRIHRRFTGSVEADPRVTGSAQLRALRERRVHAAVARRAGLQRGDAAARQPDPVAGARGIARRRGPGRRLRVDQLRPDLRAPRTDARLDAAARG